MSNPLSTHGRQHELRNHSGRSGRATRLLLDTNLLWRHHRLGCRMNTSFTYKGHSVTLRQGKFYDEAYISREPFYCCKAGLFDDFEQHVKQLIDNETTQRAERRT